MQITKKVLDKLKKAIAEELNENRQVVWGNPADPSFTFDPSDHQQALNEIKQLEMQADEIEKFEAQLKAIEMIYWDHFGDDHKEDLARMYEEERAWLRHSERPDETNPH